MAEIFRYTDIDIVTSPGPPPVTTNFRVRSEYYGFDREWQGQNDVIVTAAAVNGRRPSPNSVKPIDDQLVTVSNFSEPAATELTKVLNQQKYNHENLLLE